MHKEVGPDQKYTQLRKRIDGQDKAERMSMEYFRLVVEHCIKNCFLSKLWGNLK